MLQEQMSNMQTALDHQAQAATPPTTNTSSAQNWQNQHNQGRQRNFQQQNIQNQQNRSGNGGTGTRRRNNNRGNQQNWQNNRNTNNNKNNNWSQNNWAQNNNRFQGNNNPPPHIPSFNQFGPNQQSVQWTPPNQQQQQQFTGGNPWNNHPFQQMYCYTHGGCNHASCNCETPVNGHQTNATFENMMGGNPKNCNA